MTTDLSRHPTLERSGKSAGATSGLRALVSDAARLQVGAHQRAGRCEVHVGADAELALQLRADALAERGLVARSGQFGADGQLVQGSRSSDDDLELGSE